MSAFEELKNEVDRGINGGNMGLPIGFPRLNKYVGIRSRVYTVLFGPTGAGKSALVDNMFILNPFDWVISNANKDNLDMHVFLFSMERSKVLRMAKWVSRYIFLQKGILIPLQKLMGWWDRKIDRSEYQYFEMCEPYIDMLMSKVEIIEGPQNPEGIRKVVKAYAEANGITDETDKWNKKYIPNNPKQMVIPIVDHHGLTRLERGMDKKQAIDKVSEYMQNFRDLYGYCPVDVAQLTRNMNNPIYSKMESFEPTLDDVKESGRPGEDADQVISIFEPLRYKTKNLSYDADLFVNEATGERHFRSVSILKNSYDSSDISIGMAMQGATGYFKELPKPKQMETFSYESVKDNSYFLMP